jgi:hypothetical protein
VQSVLQDQSRSRVSLGDLAFSDTQNNDVAGSETISQDPNGLDQCHASSLKTQCHAGALFTNHRRRLCVKLTHATETTPVNGTPPELKAFWVFIANICAMDLALHQRTILDRMIHPHAQHNDQLYMYPKTIFFGKRSLPQPEPWPLVLNSNMALLHPRCHRWAMVSSKFYTNKCRQLSKEDLQMCKVDGWMKSIRDHG